MKLANVPNCAIALEAPNCVFTITPIEPAKLVTKAIMKNKRNITTMGRMLDLLFVIRLEFLLLIIVQYSSMWFKVVC